MRSIYRDEPIHDVSCPLCETRTGRLLYIVTATESAKAFIRPTINFDGYLKLAGIIAEIWGQGECQQVRCDKCGGVYAWPHRGGDSRFYNLAFKEHVRYPQGRWEFFAATRFVERELKGPVLELGAGDGAFVRILRRAGVPANLISVVEYSEESCSQISAIDRELRVYANMERFLESAGQHTYSHVFAFQVLEHVQQPIEYLRKFRCVLRPGGLACIAVPNPARIEANEKNGLLLDMPPCHVTRFTEKGISSLAQRAGFEVIYVETEPVVYREWLREFLAYHFKRRLQNDGSVQNWMERKLPWRLATIAGAVLALPSALVHSAEPKEGGSLFCVLRAASGSDMDESTASS